MAKYELKAEKREEIKKKVRPLRNEGKVPAVVYGPLHESLNIVVDAKEFAHAFEKAEYTHMIDLTIEGEKEPTKVIIREIQNSPRTFEPIHVGFFAVDPKKKIHVDIPVELTGHSIAVKDNLGILVTPISEITVVCLPTAIPEKLIVDLGPLTDVGTAVKIKDIELPEGVEWTPGASLAENVAYIVAPQKEEIVEVAVAEGAEGEEDGEEGAEGEEKKEGEDVEKKE